MGIAFLFSMQIAAYYSYRNICQKREGSVTLKHRNFAYGAWYSLPCKSPTLNYPHVFNRLQPLAKGTQWINLICYGSYNQILLRTTFIMIAAMPMLSWHSSSFPQKAKPTAPLLAVGQICTNKLLDLLNSFWKKMPLRSVHHFPSSLYRKTQNSSSLQEPSTLWTLFATFRIQYW